MQMEMGWLVRVWVEKKMDVEQNDELISIFEKIKKCLNKLYKKDKILLKRNQGKG